MKVQYFSDTDTALIQFSGNKVAETREISEDVCIELDANGRIVSMTIEHARTQARFPELVYEEVC